MSTTNTKNRRWASFSLATFFFVSLSIGAIIAGYQAGYHRGYNSGQVQLYNETPVTETYSTSLVVGDDLSAQERADAVASLKDLITSTIRTDIWSATLGNDIRDFPANQSLIITAPGSAQKEIRELFNQLEQLATRESADDLLPALQGLASQGKTTDWIVPIETSKNSAKSGAYLERYFNATVSGLTKHWGCPRFHGDCREAGFPAWSLDQQIATWPRGAGISYVALRITDDGQLRLVSGFHGGS